jgi:hypothetical protein
VAVAQLWIVRLHDSRMEIGEVKPRDWRLRNRHCPCDVCSGEGALVFIQCPSCGHVTLVCDEVGTVFKQPTPDKLEPCGSWISEPDVCPHCSRARLSEFDYAPYEAILAVGIKPRDITC